MRKLKLQIQMTLDGFVGRTHGEMDWVNKNWDEEIGEYVTSITDPVDCILLGRKLAESFIPHWAGQPQNEPQSAIDKMNDTQKVVFSRSLEESKWPNTIVAKGGLAHEINRLKAQPGGDIMAYGGAGFASSLVWGNLIDEYHLFINPSVIGQGMSIFRDVDGKQKIRLKSSRSFNCGIVVLCYERIDQ
jgi:dihydrofolate reductase